MDFIKFLNDQAIEAYPELKESIDNPNLELAYTITAERINQKVSKDLLSKRLNCTVGEITRIEAGIFEEKELLDKIVDFLNIKGDFFRKLKVEQFAVV